MIEKEILKLSIFCGCSLLGNIHLKQRHITVRDGMFSLITFMVVRTFLALRLPSVVSDSCQLKINTRLLQLSFPIAEVINH